MSVTIRPYRGKSDVYEVDMRFAWQDGTQFRRRFRAPVKTEAQATKWGEAKERELYARGKPQPAPEPKKEVPTLREYVPVYMTHARAEKQKASTIDWKQRVLEKHIAPVLGTMRLDAIETADVQRLKESLADHGRKSVNNVLTVLSHLYTVAIDGGVVATRPKIKRLRHALAEPPFYEFDEYARLVEAARKHHLAALVAVLLGGDAGLRRGEILSLKWADVNLPRKMLTVRTSVWRSIEDTPKSGRTRVIPMTTALAAALTPHRHLRGPYVLCADDGSRLRPNDIQAWVETATTRAMLTPTRSLHILRHTFCSHLAMRGAPVKAIQELAGHATLTMTLRYMHLSKGATDAAIRLLDARQSGEGVEKASAALA